MNAYKWAESTDSLSILLTEKEREMLFIFAEYKRLARKRGGEGFGEVVEEARGVSLEFRG